MSHLVFARKYRPKNLDEVVGQRLVTSILKAAIKQNRLAHALLFTGSRGVGKTTIARIVAKSLVCPSLQNGNPCNKCQFCISIDDFSSMDVMEIDGASNTGVDDVRNLRDSAKYQPASAKYKIFIIDEVHMLSQNAFNALLKILEEPPEHVVFIFATTEAHKIPKTILSRCQRYDFERSSEIDIFDNVKNILSHESLNFTDDAIKLLAKLGDGSMRDALSLLEQVVNIPKNQYQRQDVAEILGVIDSKVVQEMALAMLTKDIGKGLLLIQSVYETGRDLCQLLDGVCEYFRLLCLLKIINNLDDIKKLLPQANEDDKSIVDGFSPQDLRRCFAMSLDGLSMVFSSQKPFLAAELLVLKIAQRPDFSEATDINYYLQKLDSFLSKRPLSENELTLNSTPTVELEKKKPETAFFIEVEKSCPPLMGHLRHGKLHADKNLKNVTLTFQNTLHHEKVSGQTGLLRKIVQELFGEEFSLEIFLDKQEFQNLKTSLTPAQVEENFHKQQKALLYEKAQNHPLIKHALEIFKGKITTVLKHEEP